MASHRDSPRECGPEFMEDPLWINGGITAKGGILLLTTPFQVIALAWATRP